MKRIEKLTITDKSIRTQITLTAQIKALIEKEARKRKESLSEYLRKAALLRFLLEEEEKKLDQQKRALEEKLQKLKELENQQLKKSVDDLQKETSRLEDINRVLKKKISDLEDQLNG